MAAKSQFESILKWLESLVSKSANGAPNLDILVSAASIWELAIKSSLGKLRLSRNLDDEFYEAVVRHNIQFLHVQYQHAACVATLPFRHRDPFDRLLVAQCVVENLTLISQDIPLDAYDIRRLW